MRRLCILGVLMWGCGDPPAKADPPVRVAPIERAQPPAPRAAEPAMPAVPWSDPMPLAAGITQTHYVPALSSGQPYAITDAATGTRYAIKGPDVLEDAHGKARSYPVSETEGHVLAGTVADDGTALVLDFRVRWDADVRTMDGSSGAFAVVSASVHQVGDGPERSTFARAGTFWTRSPAP